MATQVSKGDSVLQRIINGEKIQQDSATNFLLLFNLMPLFAGDNGFQSRFPNFYFLKDSEIISTIKNQTLISKLRIFDMQISTISQHGKKLNDLTPRLNKIIIDNDLLAEWEYLHTFGAFNFSLLRLTNDQQFIDLMKELRIYRISSKAYEDFLHQELIPQVLQEIDNEIK